MVVLYAYGLQARKGAEPVGGYYGYKCKNGVRRAAEVEAEFRDQIKTGDTKNGLLRVEDLPEDVRKAIE